MRRTFLMLGLAFLLSMVCAPGTFADTKAAAAFTRGEIFLIRWEIVHDVSATPDVVRRAYHSTTVLRDGPEIAGLLNVLNPAALHPAAAGTDRKGDFRLVVDLIRADGTKETFAAEYGRLVRLSDGASRPIDGAFRKQFSFSSLAATP